MTNDANFAYRESEALTTDPVGLVVVLYDMLLKDIREAVSALSAADIERRAAAIRHGLLVLQQLQSTLDMKQGGVVAQNLDRFYNYIRAKLLEAQIKSSSEILEQQVTFVASIRDAWRQVRSEQMGIRTPADTTDESVAPVSILEGEPSSLAQWSA
jgi:flagellar secretion chaperone FliS